MDPKELFDIEEALKLQRRPEQDYTLFEDTLPQNARVDVSGVPSGLSIAEDYAPTTRGGIARQSSARDSVLGQIERELQNSSNASAGLPDVTDKELTAVGATSVLPALLGLILKGKEGLGIGAAIGGKFGENVRQQFRQEAIKQAELQNINDRERRQLLQSAGQLVNQQEREKAMDERARLDREASAKNVADQIAGQDERARKRDQDRIEAEERKKEQQNSVKLVEYQKVNNELKSYGVEVAPTISEDGVASTLDKNAAQDIRNKTATYTTALKLFDDLINSDPNDTAFRTQTANNLILILKSDDINKGGSAFTGLEYGLNSAGLPKKFANFNSPDITSDSLNALGNWMNNADISQQVIDAAKYYRERAADELGAKGAKVKDFYVTEDGKELPTIWGRIGEYQSTRDRILNPQQARRGTTSSLTDFNMDRARRYQQAYRSNY